MKTAKLIRKMDGFRGFAELYSLSEPLAGFDFVVVSAVCAPFSGDETLIFGCNEDGSSIDYTDLDGSFRGAQDTAQALNKAGYHVVR